MSRRSTSKPKDPHPLLVGIWLRFWTRSVPEIKPHQRNDDKSSI
jgi:hypothetical protein